MTRRPFPLPARSRPRKRTRRTGPKRLKRYPPTQRSTPVPRVVAPCATVAVPRSASADEGGANAATGIAPTRTADAPGAGSSRRRRARFALAGTLAAALVASVAWIGSGHGPRSVPPTLAGCIPTTPIVTLATRSKYRADDPVAATLGANAAGRAETLQPIRADVLRISRGAYGEATDRRCATRELVRWARAGALTDMRTKDAMLSRARLLSELTLAAVALRASGDLAGADGRFVSDWAEETARSTVRWFEKEAGPRSRRNNHRLWAALAVGSAARLAERPELASWARESRDLALCGLDANGHLPLELARGERALRYHVYALRPLLALQRLEKGSPPRSCPRAVGRLKGAVATMLNDPSAVSRVTGRAQLPPAAASAFGPALGLPGDLLPDMRARR